MARVRADLWALIGCLTDPLWRRTRWRWALRLEDAVFTRHLAARITAVPVGRDGEAVRTVPLPRPGVAASGGDGDA